MGKILFFTGTFLILYVQIVFCQDNLQDYDVKQYILDLQVSNSSSLISGNVTINAIVTASALDSIQVDLIDTIVAGQCYMVVDTVFVNGFPALFQHKNNKITILLAQPLLSGELFRAKIFYHGNASPVYQTGGNGIFVSQSGTNRFATTWSEPDGARVWWPCKQDLTDKADSVTIYLTTERSNKTGSNGLLKSIVSLADGSRVRYKWVSCHPIDYYLVSFAAGPYKEVQTFAPIHGGQDSILLQSLLDSTSSEYPFQLKVIEKTKKLMDLYSNIFCDYPFRDEKYGYSVYGPGIGAMENQTMTTIGADAMDTTAVLYAGTYNYWYTAHELGHSWFGDLVTCADWNDLWLNEGFASYVEYIALQNIESQKSADKWINFAHDLILSQPGGSVYGSTDDRLVYKKGAAILHILRYEMNNDSLFFAVLRNYLNTYKDSVASATDFKHIAEVTTGLDFTNFFNQWYYGQGYPSFNITWSQADDTLTIESVQTTSMTTTPLFITPFDLRINTSNGDTLVRLFQASNRETFKLYFAAPADSVEFDPENWLIQKSTIHLGIKKIRTPVSFKIIPNPVVDRMTLTLGNEDISKHPFISIYNIQGQLCLQRQISKDKTEIDVSRLMKGMYFLKLNTCSKIEVSGFVKE